MDSNGANGANGTKPTSDELTDMDTCETPGNLPNQPQTPESPAKNCPNLIALLNSPSRPLRESTIKPRDRADETAPTQSSPGTGKKPSAGPSRKLALENPAKPQDSHLKDYQELCAYYDEVHANATKQPLGNEVDKNICQTCGKDLDKNTCGSMATDQPQKSDSSPVGKKYKNDPATRRPQPGCDDCGK